MTKTNIQKRIETTMTNPRTKNRRTRCCLSLLRTRSIVRMSFQNLNWSFQTMSLSFATKMMSYPMRTSYPTTSYLSSTTRSLNLN
jgi:hypothetical protein